MAALDETMDRPIAGDGSWMRINLGHLITIGTLVIGFLVTAAQVKDQVGTVQSDVADLKKSVQALQTSINTNAITLTTMSDQITDLKTTQANEEKHLDLTDTRVSALESLAKTLDTNMQLINQQLQYIGTAHIQPSTKK